MTYMLNLQERKLRRCTYYKPRPDTVSYCDLEDVPCQVEQGDYNCEEWHQVQADWLKEEHEEKPRRPISLVRDKRNGGE